MSEFSMTQGVGLLRQVVKSCISISCSDFSGCWQGVSHPERSVEWHETRRFRVLNGKRPGKDPDVYQALTYLRGEPQPGLCLCLKRGLSSKILSSSSAVTNREPDMEGKEVHDE